MSRIQRWKMSVTGWVDGVLAQIENHEATVTAAITRVRQATARARVQLKRVERDQHALRESLREEEAAVDAWRRRAKAAADEERALECLRRHKASARRLGALRQRLGEHERSHKELSEGMPVSYRDLLSLMMIVSDNTATDLVVETVGFENVNKTMQELGLKNTKVVKYCREILFDLVGINNLSRAEMTLDVFKKATEGGDYTGTWSLGVEDNDVTTPNEMNTLLELVATGKAASLESCLEILGIMAKCQTGGYRIPKYLPSKKVQLQRKTGSLPGVRNDVGIITIRETGERYALSCFTMKAEDNYMAEETIAKVSQAVYEYFS